MHFIGSSFLKFIAKNAKILFNIRFKNTPLCHIGKFNNEVYFDAIDLVINGNIGELNKFVQEGRKLFSQVDFGGIKQLYLIFQYKVKKRLEM